MDINLFTYKLQEIRIKLFNQKSVTLLRWECTLNAR
jgi:hypothetical protein